jgi:phage shock protein E
LACRPKGVEAARQALTEGALLLDVRSPAEFRSRHVGSAINLPASSLGKRFSELGPKTQPAVVYCRSGARSSRAAKVLRARGFEQVFDLGAMSNYAPAQ